MRLSMRGRFPLLMKDLTEMASRKRTYIVRVIYAVLLFGIYGLILKNTLRHFGNAAAYNIIGQGRSVFAGAIVLQFGGLFLFLPAMMSTAISAERERDALPLIMLTDLRPWEILLEKYFGRMVPMVVFLLLGMPLVALAYSLGGVSLGQVVLLAYFLFVTLLQVGALSLMISAWCRTSVSAFIASYLGILALYFGPPIAGEVLDFHASREVLFAFCPPAVMIGLLRDELMSYHPARAAAPLLEVLSKAFLVSIPVLLSAGVFLFMARAFLVRRAFLKPRNYVLSFFRRLDAFFTSINRITGGIVLVRDKGGFPDAYPIYWRETTRKSLGKFNYLLRILLVVEMPVLLICLVMLFSRNYYRDDVRELSVLLFFLWALVALALVVRGADAVPSERSAQTLGVLLTTPMTGAQILKEKMTSVRRLAVVGAIPLITVILFEWHVESGGYSRYEDDGMLYLVGSLLTVAIYLPMLYWLGLFIGGKMQSRAKAIIAALVVLVLLCAVAPCIVIALAVLTNAHIDRSLLSLLFLGSPVAGIVALEFRELALRLQSEGLMLVVITNCVIYAGLWLLLRRWCLWRADNILGRVRTEKLRTKNDV